MIRALHVMEVLDETTLALCRAVDRLEICFDFWLEKEPQERSRCEIEELGGQILTQKRLGWRGLRALTCVVRRERYDAVHVHATKPKQIDALKAAYKGGAAVRVLELGRGPWQPDKRMRLATVCIADEQAGKAAFGERPFLLRRELLDVAAYRYDEEQRQSVRSVLDMEGRLVVGVLGTGERVLPMLKALRERDGAFRALWLDAEQGVALQGELRASGLAEHTLMVGGRSDTASLLQALDVLLCPSEGDHERMLIGAQAAGVPCLVAPDTPLEVACPALISRMETMDALAWAGAALSAHASERTQYAAWIRDAGCDVNREARRWTARYEGRETTI